MSERANVDLEAPRQESGEDAEYVSPSIRRRRAAAAAARRRRLLIVDLCLGLLIALLVILVSGGLAIVAIVLLLAVLALGIRTAFRSLRRRRAERPAGSEPRRASQRRTRPERHG